MQWKTFSDGGNKSVDVTLTPEEYLALGRGKSVWRRQQENGCMTRINIRIGDDHRSVSGNDSEHYLGSRVD